MEKIYKNIFRIPLLQFIEGMIEEINGSKTKVKLLKSGDIKEFKTEQVTQVNIVGKLYMEYVFTEL
jgi:Ribonuclease G/E